MQCVNLISTLSHTIKNVHYTCSTWFVIVEKKVYKFVIIIWDMIQTIQKITCKFISIFENLQSYLEPPFISKPVYCLGYIIYNVVLFFKRNL